MELPSDISTTLRPMLVYNTSLFRDGPYSHKHLLLNNFELINLIMLDWFG